MCLKDHRVTKKAGAVLQAENKICKQQSPVLEGPRDTFKKKL